VIISTSILLITSGYVMTKRCVLCDSCHQFLCCLYFSLVVCCAVNRLSDVLWLKVLKQLKSQMI